MTDIVLINPAASHGIYGPLGDTLIAVEPPLWMRLTAGYLRNHGFDVAVIDGERSKIQPLDLALEIERLDPRFVMILAFGHQPSASTQTMPAVREAARAIKRTNPTRWVIAAGGHISALPERTLNEETDLDYIVKGEGPRTILGLLDGGSNADIPGLGYRDNRGNSVVNAPATALDPNLDLHDQAWDLTPPSGYVAHNWHALGYPDAERRPYASIYTSLNCPFACSFCCISSPFGGPGYKTRSPESVVDEIEYLVLEHGVHFIKITDEMFILKPSHYLPIAEEIIRRDLGDKINIWAYSRVDTVRSGALPTLRKAGFRWLALGIESGSAHVRDGADKSFKNRDIVGVVREIQAADINVIGNFIFGLRDDDETTMRQTLDLAIECRPDWANFYAAHAYPGSKLYDQAIQENWTLPRDWKGFSQHNRWCRPLDTAHVGAAAVLRFRDEAFNAFFSHHIYRERVYNRFGIDGLEMVDAMLEYQLDRALLSGEIA